MFVITGGSHLSLGSRTGSRSTYLRSAATSRARSSPGRSPNTNSSLRPDEKLEVAIGGREPCMEREMVKTHIAMENMAILERLRISYNDNDGEANGDLDTLNDNDGEPFISGYIWLVVTKKHDWPTFSIQLEVSSSQLTNAYFSEGFKPPTRYTYNDNDGEAGGYL